MLRKTSGWLDKTKLLFTVLWPLVISQVAQGLITMSDTAMSGQVHPDQLAGVAIGGGIWLPVSLGIGGLLMASGPILGQQIGKGDHKAMTATVMQATYMTIGFSVVLTVGIITALPIVLGSMQLEAEVAAVAAGYVKSLLYGALPFLLSFVLRSFVNAQGYTNITMAVKLASIPVNIGLNFAFIFGKFGLPAMGGIGAGYATSITYWLVAIAFIGLVRKMPRLQQYALYRKWPKPSWTLWREFLKLGVPMGASLLLEVTLFSVIALLLGWQGFATEIIAAHQAALSLGLVMASVPIGTGAALTIVIAYELGSGRPDDARQYRRLGLGTSLTFVAITSILLYVFRVPVARLFTSEPALVPLLTQFFLFVILFQFSDAAQMALQSTLRGHKDGAVPTYIALGSYWIVGLGVGWSLATYTAFGAFGYWIGIFSGLTVAATGFYIRLRRLEARAMVTTKSTLAA